MPNPFNLNRDPFARGQTPATGWGPPPRHHASASRLDLPAALQTLRQRWKPAVAILILFSLGGVTVARRKFRPVYRGEAVVRISPLLPRILNFDDEWHKTSIEGFYNDYVRTLCHSAKERAVLANAVTALEGKDVDWIPEGVPEEEIVDHLKARITVQLIRDTHLLRIGIDDSRPEIVAPVVNEVTRSFLGRFAEDERMDQDRKVVVLRSSRKETQQKLDQTHRRLDVLSERLGSALMDEKQNIFFERIHVLDEGFSKVTVRRVQAEGALAKAQARAERLRQRVPIGLVERALEADVEVRDARVMVGRLEREVGKEVTGLSSRHPIRLAAMKRLETAKQHRDTIEKNAEVRVRKRLGSLRNEEAEELLNSAQSDLKAAKHEEESMGAALASARDDLADYGRAMFEGSQLRTQATRLLNELTDIDQRLGELELESRAPCRLTVRDWAREPNRPARNLGKPVSIAAILASLVLALSFPLIWDRRQILTTSSERGRG